MINKFQFRNLSLLSIMLFLVARPAAAMSQPRSGLLGKPAPNFTVTALDGKTIYLEKIKGSVVILNFWATGCGPCRAEIPDFVQFFREYEKKGVIILGMSFDNDDANLREFVRSYNMNYPVASDAKGRIASTYGGVKFIPTTFIIDRQGVIREMRVGQIEKEELLKLVTPYL